jgi:cytochrome c biogenesis protein
MNKTIWITWLPKTKGINVIYDNSRGVNAIYNSFGKFITYLDIGESYKTSTYNFQIIDLIYITGLQIKVDPGISIIYTGFGLLMVSILISYISFSQIWILRQQKTIFIGGRTNRAQINFEIEILNIILELK